MGARKHAGALPPTRHRLYLQSYLLHLIWSQDPDGLTLADREARLLPEPTAAALEGWYLAPIHRAPCAALPEGALASTTEWG